jgi:hypothetical protein
MTTFRPDVLIEIHYDMADATQSIIYTNAKSEALEELLSDWLQDQMFRLLRHQELVEPPDRPVYVVKIGLGLRDDGDVWGDEYDNLHLAAGIVGKTLTMLNTLSIRKRSDRMPRTG